jgi:nitrite reductase (NO-forming)
MNNNHHSSFLFAPAFSLLPALLLLLATTNIAIAAPRSERSGSAAKAVDIIRDGSDLPPAIASRPPAVVKVTLTAKEVVGVLDASAGTTYRYWTFNGKVPGPMIRVRQGDTVEVTLRNDPSSHMTHSIDFHAALGPGGGAALSQTTPGQSKTFSFQATTPGLFVYHCGTPMIAEHMANGMYGMILVEPEGGLPHVDREYYMMQGEIYTSEPKGKEGLQQFSAAKLMDEKPEYFVVNGAVDALTGQRQMPANVGETVRVFYGNAGPNATASTHMVGEIFTHMYQLGSLTSPPLTDVQTVGVPSGGAAILEFAAKTAGKFALMDHAISRMAKGNMAVFDVTGPQNAALMHSGAASQENTERAVSGITAADEASNLQSSVATPDVTPNPNKTDVQAHDSGMSAMMQMHMQVARNGTVGSRKDRVPLQKPIVSPKATSLDGCLTLAPDGKVILTAIQSAKVYRLEAQPLLFSENADRLVHVSGYFGSVLSAEDPLLPSFVVSTVDAVAANCKANLSSAQIKKVLMKRAGAERGVVTMSDMGFLPKTLVVNVGEKVFWKNTSEFTHNVVADPVKALYPVDVKLPSGVRPFGSGYLQAGQSFGHVFEVPGTYRYVCTLHEGSGMKGVIIVKGAETMRASK